MPAAVLADERFVLFSSCPVCGGGRLRVVRRGTIGPEGLRADAIRITDSAYGSVWSLSECLACGHAFANPAPRPEILAALYGRVEDPLYEAETEGRSRSFVRILERLERRLPGRGALLDVGAATGELLAIARDRGWRPSGIEPSGWAVRRAREKYGLILDETSLESARLPPRAFQAVTLIDVIEHTSSPARAMAAAAAALAPEGVLCVVTPDARSLAARLAGKRWWHCRAGHVGYFSARSLERLLRGAGLAAVEWRRYSWTFSLRYLLSRFRPLAGLAGTAGRPASLLDRLRVKLALGDSFEVYAVSLRTR